MNLGIGHRNMVDSGTGEGGSNENVDDFIFPGPVVAAAAGIMSDDTVCFIKVEQDLNEKIESSIYDYEHIPAGFKLFSD